MMNTDLIKHFRNAANFNGWSDEGYTQCFEAVSDHVSPQQFDELVSCFKGPRSFFPRNKPKVTPIRSAIDKYENSLFHGKGSLLQTG